MSRGVIPVAVLIISAIAGCNRESKEATRPTGPDASGQKFLLSQEPADARSVAEVRKEAKDGDEVVVVGRIGGDRDPWIEGRAGFVLADTALKSCLDTGDGCPTPWDYCCTPADELTRGTVSIKVVDDSGKVVGMDARQLLGVKELNTVVIRGKVEKKGDAFVVRATGVYVRPEGKK